MHVTVEVFTEGEAGSPKSGTDDRGWMSYARHNYNSLYRQQGVKNYKQTDDMKNSVLLNLIYGKDEGLHWDMVGDMEMKLRLMSSFEGRIV